MLASVSLPRGLAQCSAHTTSSGIRCDEKHKQLRQSRPQAPLQPLVPVWEQADLDSTPVPPHCNLSDVVVNFMKGNFLGTEVLRHENMQGGVQDKTQQSQLKAWKTELLQNAYEALSVELGYQTLVDSAEECTASEEAAKHL